MKEEKENKEIFDKIGKRIESLISSNYDDSITNVQKYNDIFGEEDYISDAAKANKISACKRGNVTLDTLIKISKKFGVSLDWLVFGKEDDKKSPPAETTEKPIEEYTVRDICKAFLALSKVANIEVIPNDKKDTRRIDLTGALKITAKKATCLETDYIRRDARLAVSVVDVRALQVIGFIERKNELIDFWNRGRGFADFSSAIKNGIDNLLNSDPYLDNPVNSSTVEEVQYFDFSQFDDEYRVRKGPDYSDRIINQPNFNYIIQNRKKALSQQIEHEKIYESSGGEYWPHIND